ncbi:quinone oxidoreductase family protein [Spirosoma koreense]
MKAAILQEEGTLPSYGDIQPPIPDNDQQTLISVKAAAIKQLDLLKASGNHYTHYPSFPAVVGVDGVGVLADGQRIYAMGLSGMMAEQALVATNRWTAVPDGLDDTLAAALPNALLGSDAALRHRAQIKKGDVVLINGATGITGLVAVQVAKFHGAKTVIATGRNPATLQTLTELGADEVVSLQQADEAVIQQLQEIYARTPIDIVQDYLWGHPIELILAALKTIPNHQHTRIVTVGEMAGASISLDSGLLRSRDIEFIGSGIGSLSLQAIGHYMQHELPEMLSLAATGKLTLPFRTVPLSDVAQAWQQATKSSERIVITI